MKKVCLVSDLSYRLLITLANSLDPDQARNVNTAYCCRRHTSGISASSRRIWILVAGSLAGDVACMDGYVTRERAVSGKLFHTSSMTLLLKLFARICSLGLRL